MSRTDTLIVWLGEEPVAELRRHRSRLQLQYRPEVVERFGGLPLLSCSLAVRHRPADATNFFDGLLPEGQFRAALAARARLAATDIFGLLARYGRDIAGAVAVGDPADDLANRSPRILRLTASDLDDEVARLPNEPLGLHDDSELSIAGFQNKMLLVSVGPGEWARPIAGTPSTHILKVDSQAHPGVVAAEADAMRLARTIGLTTVDVELTTFSGVPCLIVERFDRLVESGTVHRLHQEDACQALGLPPTQKYELPGRGQHRAGGGPELEQIARLLDTYARDQVDELTRLVRVATFTAAIGNADAHGKNLAFLHTARGEVVLAPLYDTVPTVLFPRLKDEAAMTIGGATDLATVSVSDIVREAGRWHLDAVKARTAAIETAESLRDASISGVIDALGPVARLVQARVERLLGDH